MSRAEDIFEKLIYFGEDAIDEYIVNMQTEEPQCRLLSGAAPYPGNPPCFWQSGRGTW